MARQKLEIIILGSIISLFVVNFILQGSNGIIQDKFVVIKGYDECDTTYSIMSTSLKTVVYYGHWNLIILDTIINNNYIFIEDIYTEECWNRLVVCNQQKDSLLRAFNYNWCYELNHADLEILRKGVKAFTTESIDEINRTITIKYFNNKIQTLELQTVEY